MKETGDVSRAHAPDSLGHTYGALAPAVPPVIPSLPATHLRRGMSCVNAEVPYDVLYS